MKKEDKEKKVQVISHIEELRKRILISIFVLFLTSLLAYPISPLILNKIREDLLLGYKFVVLSPQEGIIVYIKISLLIGFILSFPILVFEFWSFIAPGLKEKEGKFFILVFTSSVFLFLLGFLFAYFILLPITMKFLIKIASSVSLPFFSLNKTFNFIITLLITFGIIFQLPLIVGILTKLKLISPEVLSSKRKYVILSVFIIAALITDPSVITQILVAIPILILYEVSILISKFIIY